MVERYWQQVVGSALDNWHHLNVNGLFWPYLNSVLRRRKPIVGGTVYQAVKEGNISGRCLGDGEVGLTF
jgi:hypothetical protein